MPQLTSLIIYSFSGFCGKMITSELGKNGKLEVLGSWWGAAPAHA